MLLTSELVTNALLHARSAPELDVRLVDGRLRVGVSDTTPVAPVRKRYGKEAATGRGLLLIETMASAWGTDPNEGGKEVWFELAAPDEGRDGTSAEAAMGSTHDRPAGDDRGPAASRNRRPPSGGPRARTRQADQRLRRPARP